MASPALLSDLIEFAAAEFISSNVGTALTPWLSYAFLKAVTSERAKERRRVTACYVSLEAAMTARSGIALRLFVAS